MSEERTYNGVDLIDKILEFVAMTPNDSEWNYNALKSNPPRLIRLKQINSLFDALSFNKPNRNLINKTISIFNPDLSKEINSLLQGDFIDIKETHVPEQTSKFMTNYLHNKHIDLGVLKEIRSVELKFIYPKLLNYKIKIREILSFNSGWLETSFTSAFFHITLTDNISSNLKNRYDDLDNILNLIINPRQLKFTEKELIEKHNYPVADLREIDMDNY